MRVFRRAVAGLSAFSMTAIFPVLGLSSAHARQSCAMHFRHQQVVDTATNSAATGPAMPAGVLPRFDVSLPDRYRQSFPTDILNLAADAFAKDHPAEPITHYQADQLRQFVTRLAAIVLQSTSASIGVEQTGPDPVIYAAVRWSTAMDTSTEIRRLVGLANALNSKRQDDVEMQSYPLGTESVLRLIVKQNGSPLAYVDAVQRDRQLFLAISPNKQLHIDRLLSAGSVAQAPRGVSRQVELPLKKTHIARVSDETPTHENIFVVLVKSVQETMATLQSTEAPSAELAMASSSGQTILSPVAKRTTPLLAVALSETRDAEVPQPASNPSARPEITAPIEPTSQPATIEPRGPESRPASGGDLRALIGVNPGLKRADVTRFPNMSLRGFIKPRGLAPMALLEIAELNRDFLVQAGTEIPVTVQGKVTAVGRSELTGLSGPGKSSVAPVRSADGQEQSQIILKVVKVSEEGVTVEAGLLDQTITVR